MSLYKRIVILIIAIFTISLGLVISGVNIINKTAHESLKDEYKISTNLTIYNYFESMKDELNNYLITHAYWTELIENIDTKNIEWIEDNVTKYMYDDPSLDIDLVILALEDGTVIDAHSSFDISHITKTKEYNTILSDNRLVSFFTVVDKELYLVSGSSIRDNEYENPFGVFIIARRIDDKVLDNLSKFVNPNILYKINISDTTKHIDFAPESINHFDIEYPISNDNKVISYIILEYYQPIFELLFKTKINHILVVISSILILASIVFVIQTGNVARFIYRTIDSIKTIAEGNYNVKLEETGTVEMKHLASSINYLTNELEDKIVRIEDNYIQSIEMMAKALEVNDEYTAGHAERVANLSMRIGEKIGYTSIKDLEIAGLLHDIGKISIPYHILNKDSRLTYEEYETMKKHPSTGYEILDKAIIFEDIKDIVLYHHEQYNGNGYPKGLSGDEIPLGSRILCIADAFDAMTSDRAYRSKMSVKEALHELSDKAGMQFDPDIVSVFKDLIESNKINLNGTTN